MVKYIEMKSGHGDNGPAWVARVVLSRSGTTVYFGTKALRRAKGLIAGNHYDIRTGEEYWVSGVKKRGTNRHPAGSGIISIERSAVSEYLAETGLARLDESLFRVVKDLPKPDPSQFLAFEHEPLGRGRRTTRCS
jgi:hypothetical protein